MDQKLEVGQWVYIVQRVSNRNYLDKDDYEVSSAKIKRIGRKYVDVVNLSSVAMFPYIFPYRTDILYVLPY